jgi:DNA-directed RNA polymerase subunit RPC12/RpoP
MKPAPKNPTGYVCSGCGAEHSFPPYVAAHWFENMTHTCPQCQAQHVVREGIARIPGPRGHVNGRSRQAQAMFEAAPQPA